MTRRARTAVDHWKRAEITRALNTALRGGRKWRRPHLKVGDIQVWQCHPKLPHGHSIHAASTLSHEVDTAYVAWRDGEPVGYVVVWKCGTHSRKVHLTTEPGRRECLLCPVYPLRRNAR